MTILEELGQATRTVAERAGASVVGIGRGWGLGSGIVIGDNLVATNAHNVGGDEVSVSFGIAGTGGGDRVAVGRVKAVDVDADVAVVEVDTGGVEALVWSSVEASVGTPVFALARPGGRQLRVTFGLVSATDRAFRGPRGRRIAGSIEHTAPLAKGSSGGPVVDTEGRVLGLNTHRLGEGFYLALPADETLRARLDVLGRGESPGRVRLGVALAPRGAARNLRQAVGLPPRDGVLLRAVEDESPAARAGLRTGDLIVAAGDRPVGGIDDLHEVLDTLSASDQVNLRIVRATEELELSVSFSTQDTTEPD